MVYALDYFKTIKKEKDSKGKGKTARREMKKQMGECAWFAFLPELHPPQMVKPDLH